MPILTDLPNGARVGTGSLRRQAQLRHRRPDLHIREVRGNVDTRLRKLDEGQFDAVVLAEAGLRRLGLGSLIQHVLPFDIMLPAVGQGALGIECRASDDRTFAALQLLDDEATHSAVTAERALLEAFARRVHGADWRTCGGRSRRVAITGGRSKCRWLAPAIRIRFGHRGKCR